MRSLFLFFHLSCKKDYAVGHIIVLMVIFWDILIQISLMEECSFLERALEELHKKEFKIVSIVKIVWWSRCIRELTQM